MNLLFQTKTNVLLCLILAVFLFPETLTAQVERPSKALNHSIAQKAFTLLQNNLSDSEPLPPAPPASVLHELQDFLQTQLFQTEMLKDNWYSGKIEQLRRQTGLNLSANYQHNEFGAFYENLDDGSRFRAGLEFDLLENGLVEKRNARKRLQKDQEIHRMESIMGSRERDYAFLYNCLIYQFNIQKISLLNERIPFLQEYISLLYELYFAHEMAYDQIIDQKSRLKEAEIMRAAAHQFNEALEQEIGMENIAALDAAVMPIVQIDIEQLLNADDLNAYQDRLKTMKEERIDLSYRKRLDARLKLYSRYNYGNHPTNVNTERAFTSFGISFQTPIQFNRRTPDELATYEKAMVAEEVSEVWYNRVKEMMIIYEEYQYKLKQYSNFLHKTFRLHEKLRVEQVMLDSHRDVHSPLKAIRHIDNSQAVDYELLGLKQQLYLLLLKMHLRSFKENFIDCLETIDFSKENKKLTGQRFALIDASRDQALDPFYLIKYLQNNEINNIMLRGQGGALGKWAAILQAEGFQLYAAEDQPPTLPAALQASMSGNYRTLSYSGQLLVSSRQKTRDIPALQIQLTTVPHQIFNTRNELERWIELEEKTNGTQFFLFEDIRHIMDLDKQNLGVE